MVGSTSSPRSDLLIRRKFKRCLHNDCTCQLRGATLKDFSEPDRFRVICSCLGNDAGGCILWNDTHSAKGGFKEDLGGEPHRFLQSGCPRGWRGVKRTSASCKCCDPCHCLR